MTIQAIKKKASEAADPKCKICHGTGTTGFVRNIPKGKVTLRNPEGQRRVLICRCASSAFPELNKKKKPSLSDMLRDTAGFGIGK